MNKLVVLFFISLLVVSCKDDNKVLDAVAEIPMKVEVERFDQLFTKENQKDLQKIKKAYPFMFSNRFTDEFYIEKINDSLQVELQKETKTVFSDFSEEIKDIELLFKHLKYYNNNFKKPRVITATSDVDYRNKVIVTDTIVLISIDTYLGAKHKFYEGLQDFIKANMKSSQLVVDMAEEYAKQQIFQPKRKSLLDEMVYYGKILYFKDQMIPFKTDAEKIGYTEAQYDWAKVNEENVWRYFIERELLYSTNSKLPNQFINPAPFSKFYLEEIDADSPGRIGRFIGWQIVKAYAENNDVNLEKILQTDAETIFNASKYKPQL